MLQFLDTANSYKAGLGGKVNWDKKVNKTQTLDQYTRDEVKEAVSVKYVMSSMAKKENVALSNSEKNEIKQAANKYYNGLTETEKEYTKAKVKDVEKL